MRIYHLKICRMASPDCMREIERNKIMDVEELREKVKRLSNLVKSGQLKDSEGAKLLCDDIRETKEQLESKIEEIKGFIVLKKQGDDTEIKDILNQYVSVLASCDRVLAGFIDRSV